MVTIRKGCDKCCMWFDIDGKLPKHECWKKQDEYRTKKQEFCPGSGAPGRSWSPKVSV